MTDRSGCGPVDRGRDVGLRQGIRPTFVVGWLLIVVANSIVARSGGVLVGRTPGGTAAIPALSGLDAEDIALPDDDPAPILEFDDELLGQDLLGDHPAPAGGDRHNGPHRRQAAFQLAIGVVLVTPSST